MICNNDNDDNNATTNKARYVRRPAYGFGSSPRGVERRLRSKQRDPNPNNNSLVRKQCCKRRMESLTCRCFLSYSLVREETSTYKGFRSTFAALLSY